MIISIIVAMDQNNLIGDGSSIPWYIPEDLSYFRDITYGKPVIMGRKTHESIGKVLMGRDNIVMSKSGFQSPYTDKIRVFSGVDKILQDLSDKAEIFVIGGKDIYNIFLPYTNKMYLTRIFSTFRGDIFFPHFNLNEWILNSRVKSTNGKHKYEFQIWDKEQKK
jgi:dihydrofolate reductase